MVITEHIAPHEFHYWGMAEEHFDVIPFGLYETFNTVVEDILGYECETYQLNDLLAHEPEKVFAQLGYSLQGFKLPQTMAYRARKNPELLYTKEFEEFDTEEVD